MLVVLQLGHEPVDSRQTEGDLVKVDGDRAAAHPQATCDKLGHRHPLVHHAEAVVHDKCVLILDGHVLQVCLPGFVLQQRVDDCVVQKAVAGGVDLEEDVHEALDDPVLSAAALNQLEVTIGSGRADRLVDEDARQQIEDAEVVERREEDKDLGTCWTGFQQLVIVVAPVVAACGRHVQGEHRRLHRAEAIHEVLAGLARELADVALAALLDEEVLHHLDKQHGEDHNHEEEEDEAPEEREQRTEEGNDDES
mmetsp:Transcript_84288/g.181759  ORF Transcript_84288/g.181759 Transcript_84288/m.181759 type:complete len:252 (-) Transcript_84288:1070-1825(-)